MNSKKPFKIVVIKCCILVDTPTEVVVSGILYRLMRDKPYEETLNSAIHVLTLYIHCTSCTLYDVVHSFTF